MIVAQARAAAACMARMARVRTRLGGCSTRWWCGTCRIRRAAAARGPAALLHNAPAQVFIGNHLNRELAMQFIDIQPPSAVLFRDQMVARAGGRAGLCARTAAWHSSVAQHTAALLKPPPLHVKRLNALLCPPACPALPSPADVRVPTRTVRAGGRCKAGRVLAEGLPARGGFGFVVHRTQPQGQPRGTGLLPRSWPPLACHHPPAPPLSGGCSCAVQAAQPVPGSQQWIEKVGLSHLLLGGASRASGTATSKAEPALGGSRTARLTRTVATVLLLPPCVVRVRSLDRRHLSPPSWTRRSTWCGALT